MNRDDYWRLIAETWVRDLAALEGDACDCPACEPRCRKTGEPCFILCAKCSGKAESDEVGDLKSVTRRI